MHRYSVLAAVAAAAASVLLSTPAAAQEARIGQAQVYRSVMAADIATLLNGKGYASVKKVDSRFDVETTEGFKFSVELAVCDAADSPPGCLGVNIFATWGMNPGDRTKLQAAVERFNNEYRIGKALLVDNSVYAERYVITDGGVTMAHISDELDEFESLMDVFIGVMQEALGT